MVRKFGALAAGLAVIALCLSATAADKEPTIKDVMKTVSGKGGACKSCAEAAKGEKWEDAQKLAKQMAECGVALTKTKCPKGDAESWTKLTKKYCEDVAAVSKAADSKDSKAFDTALKTFTTSCKTCHDAHK